MGSEKYVIDENGVLIKVKTPELIEKYKNQKTIVRYLGGRKDNNITNDRYRIPPLLIKALFVKIE